MLGVTSSMFELKGIGLNSYVLYVANMLYLRKPRPMPLKSFLPPCIFVDCLQQQDTCYSIHDGLPKSITDDACLIQTHVVQITAIMYKLCHFKHWMM
jgi:hypothetical protein